MALKITHRDENEDRICERLRDEKTGRQFVLTFFKAGAQAVADSVELMVQGRDVHWHASEMRPNGVLVDDNNRTSIVVDRKQVDRVSKAPSKFYRLMNRQEKAHPGLFMVLTGGGRGTRSIYHPDRDLALKAIKNALASDTWLVEMEPIRTRRVGRKATITLGDYALLQKAPGQEKIMQALGSVEKLLKRTHKIEIQEQNGGLRIEVRDTTAGLEYPDNLRLLITFNLAGRPHGYRFARSGFYEIADAIVGATVPRFDQPAYFLTNGFPAYGQTVQFIAPSAPVPEGWRLKALLGCRAATADKVYAWLVEPDGRHLVVWGRRENAAFQSKFVTYQYAADAIDSRAGRYDAITEREVPEFWGRVLSAASKKK